MNTFKVAFDWDWTSHFYIQQLKVHLGVIDVEVISPKSLDDWLNIKAFHMHLPYGWLRANTLKSSINLVRFMLRLLVLKCFRKRLIWTVHDLFDHGKGDTPLVKLSIYLLAIISDTLVCHCEASKKELCKKFRASDHKIHVASHPNFIGVYPNQTTREEARNKFGLMSIIESF